MNSTLIASNTKVSSRLGIRACLVGMVLNLILAIIKGVAGVLGNSYALVADAIESASDVVSSFIVLFGLKMSSKPADENHPYGHGKFEPLAAASVAMILFGAAIFIAIKSIQEIITPHHAPAAFTLIVLVLVVVAKEFLFRYVVQVGIKVNSLAMKSDAWHHRSDAITSVAAFIGISIALIGGEGYETADDFAALVAAFVILVNASLLLKPALLELIDTRADPEIAKEIREIAQSVAGVLGTHKCNVRKLGFDYFVDLDILCDPEKTIREGHDLSHKVGEAIHEKLPIITKILVHVEPVDDFGRRG